MMGPLGAKAFRGKAPRVSSRLLPPSFGSEALNAKITSGRLDPIKGPLLVHTSLAAAIGAFYRYRFGGQDNWLVWGVPVDVARSPTAQDALGRLYWSGDGEPRMSTFADAITGAGPFPAAWFVLGVYFATAAFSVVVTGGTGTMETRSYVYTFKTKYGEEGPPCDIPNVTNGFQNGSWDLSGMEAPPPNSGAVTAAATVATGIVEVTLNTNRGLAQYEQVTFAGNTGMTDLNGTFDLVAVLPANKVRVALATAQVLTAGGTWARRAPHNLTGMKRCIYRTVGTNADYKLVAEIDAATTSYSDTIAGTALGESLPTMESYTPPKNLRGLRELANGSFAGIAGNEICYSEQYKPYSWPLANRYGFAGIGVGTCATESTLIVLTDSYPIASTATVPESASPAKIPGSPYAPCVSKQSIVETNGGCYYVSFDGVYFAWPGGVKKVTDNLYTYDEWQAIMPATVKASFWDGRYYAMHDGQGGAPSRILVMDVPNPDSVVEVDEHVDAIYANPYDGKLYIAKGNKISQWDADDANRYLIFWAGPEYELPAPMNFARAQVFAKYSDIVPLDTSIAASNAALMLNLDNIIGCFGDDSGQVPWGGTNLEEVPAQTANKVQFTLVADGDVIFTKDLNSIEPFTLPSDNDYELVTMQITSTVPVSSIAIAESSDLLSGFSQ